MDAALPASAYGDVPSGTPTHVHHSDIPTLQHYWQSVTNGLPLCPSCHPQVEAHFAAGFGQWPLPSSRPGYVWVTVLMPTFQIQPFHAVTSISSTSTLLSSSTAPGTAESSSNPATPSLNISPTQRRPRGVKIACTNCRVANKRCDNDRPCERCVRKGLEDSCVNAERRPRKRTVRRTATAITLSATQVAVESVPHEEGVSVPVNIAAATSPSIDDSQYMADGASPSSNSDSPSAGPLDESTFDSFFIAAASEQEHGISNLWTGSVSIQQQQQQQHYSTWTTFNGVMDSHHPHAGVELGQGLSSGIGGYGGFPSSAQHQHF